MHRHLSCIWGVRDEKIHVREAERREGEGGRKRMREREREREREGERRKGRERCNDQKLVNDIFFFFFSYMAETKLF